MRIALAGLILMMTACASPGVKCDVHLMPINPPKPKEIPSLVASPALEGDK